jgi:TM2 domain-containing membrane protein YozV
MSEGDVQARNPAAAGALSFLLPGLGQLYNGQPLLGLAFLASVYVGALLCGIRFIGALGSPDPRAALSKVMFWGGLATFLWLGGVVQAVFAALDRSEYSVQRYNHPLMYVGIIAVAYLIAPLTLSGAVFRWMLARNGIVTEDQVRDWEGRMTALRAGVRPSRSDATVRDGKAPADTLALQVPTNLPDPEVAARGAATVIHLVLVGGPDGGVYDMHSKEATCTFRGGNEPSWTNLYANPADSQGVTAIQFRVAADTGTTANFQLNVNLGNIPRGRAYFVDGRTAPGGTTRPAATVVRRGAGAVIRMVAETPDRVRIEATIQCRSVVAG